MPALANMPNSEIRQGARANGMQSALDRCPAITNAGGRDRLLDGIVATLGTEMAELDVRVRLNGGQQGEEACVPTMGMG
jgi:hypothetical protein